MTYTQAWDMMNNRPHETLIVRDEDGAFIPADPGNRDYQDYLAWLDAGNQPAAASSPSGPAQPAPFREPTFRP